MPISRGDIKGAYDDECERLREELDAKAVGLIVVKGKKGHGFSFIAGPELMVGLPDLLRSMANQIEQDMKEDKGFDA